MEEITMEKLLNNFKEVIDQFDDLVKRRDTVAIKKVLSQVEKLLSNDDKIELDNLENSSVDNILHKLLKSLSERLENKNIVEQSQSTAEYKKEDELLELLSQRSGIITELKKIEADSETNIDEDLLEKIETLEKEITRREVEKENALKKLANDDITRQIYDEVTNQFKKELENLKIQLKKSNKENNEIDSKINIIKQLIKTRQVELEEARQNENNDINIQWKKDLEISLEVLEEELQNAENEKNNQVKNKSIHGTKTKDEFEEELRIIDEKINEINSRLLQKDNSDQKQPIDFKQMVDNIGEKIFKTAEIRKQLSERQISRREFIEFYEQGKEFAVKNINKIDLQTDKIEKELETLFIDSSSDKNLYQQIKDDEMKKDFVKIIPRLEEIRKRLLNLGYTDDILKTEIQTEELAQNFQNYYHLYCQKMQDRLNILYFERNGQEDNIKIFDHEISEIHKEAENIKLYYKESLDNINRKALEEKKLRARQIRATIYGDEELNQEWEERFKRFYSHKREDELHYTDRNGNIANVRYETIGIYPEYEEDAYFLNLEDYKTNLEIVTRYRNSGNDRYALGRYGIEYDDVIESYDDKKEIAEEVFESLIAEREDYIKTFHGHTNKYKVKYDNYKSAGSTLKSMIPLKNLSPIQKVGATTLNVLNFFGIRKPEFIRVDEDGDEVIDIKKGMATVLTNTLVVGGVALTGLIAGPVGLAAIGTAYLAKGAVTVGNLVAAMETKEKYKYEIENNIPTPNESDEDSKEVARKNYYRQEENMGKFTSWIRAKSDRFLPTRAKQTEDKIIELRIKKSNKVINDRAKKAETILKRNIEKVNNNQRIREENYRKAVLSEQAYNEIVKDPNSIDIEQTVSNLVQNATLGRYNKGGRNINPNSKQKEIEKYVKKEEEYEQTEMLENVVYKGGTISSTAITEQERYQGRQQKQDRINRILTVILSIGGKISLDSIRENITNIIGKNTTVQTEFNQMQKSILEGSAISIGVEAVDTIQDMIVPIEEYQEGNFEEKNPMFAKIKTFDEIIDEIYERNYETREDDER